MDFMIKPILRELEQSTSTAKVYHACKPSYTRIFDLILVLWASPFILPIIAFIAVLIKLDSKGSIFFRQCRIGKNGDNFEVLKFRTMVPNAEEKLRLFLKENPDIEAEWLANHKLKEDPRITRIGKWLRKLSLDELPQLWNILIGEMGLIGPRPIVEEEIAKYERCFEIYKQARPGLTGLWQVSGRNDTSYEQRVKLDEYYLLNWSLSMDIKILLKTVKVVLRGNGAY